MDLNIGTRVELNNGIKMPRFGLGVYQADSGGETEEAVRTALDDGYRLIDTASAYGNEADVGKGIRESGIDREEIFVTTKLWNDDQGYDKAIKAFDTSLEKLGLEYVDLYLVHWPVSGKRIDSYKALEKILKSGKSRAIGVSNFTIRHLEELIKNTEIVPAVNQVEFHSFLFQKELMEFCKENNIQLEAYSPIARAKKFNNPVIQEMSKKYSKTPAQIMIRWILQHKVIAIPKSTHEKRIKENADVFDFEITENDMEKIDSINESMRIAWDPSEIE